MAFDIPYAMHEAMEGCQKFGAASASLCASMLGRTFDSVGLHPLAAEYRALGAMFGHAAHFRGKPAWGLLTTKIDENDVSVTEEVVLSKNFGNLLHFKRDTDRNDPKILLVAPLSGHYATLLRGTVEGLLPYHDVYVAEWGNARDVPCEIGKFDHEDYIGYIQDYMAHLGPDTHVMAVCQPGPLVLSAVALMAARNDPNQPLSMTLMGSPIDTTVSQTAVNRFAEEHDMGWFKKSCLATVPLGYAGYGRHVYPGYNQLTAFLGMNPGRHVRSSLEMYDDLRRGDGESAGKKMEFYDEYLAVMDMTAEFYLGTIHHFFKNHSLQKGDFTFQDQIVDFSALKKTALLTVEGGRDDICGLGQTSAAQRLCNNIAPRYKFHHLEEQAGHYGIFEGRRYREEILPRIAGFVRQMAVDKGLNYSEIPSNTWSKTPNLWKAEGRPQGLTLAA